MTQDKTISVTCPACFEEENFRIHPFVDAKKDPHLKEDIFSRDIFRFSCPQCGEEILVSYNCTYLDEENKFMVSLVTDADDLDIETSGYHFRIVRSINEFVEKLALMEDAVDDRIVELYKIMLEDQFEDERPGAKILGIYYGGKNVHENTLLFFIITENAENCRATLSMQVYETISAQFKESAEKFSSASEINRDWAIGVLQSNFQDNRE